MILSRTMKAEYRKREPDVEKVGKLMEITFSSRRQLLKDGIPIKDLVEQYPCLMLKNEV